MRLLDKKEITADSALERKRQIDEGLRLAKRIDALRQTELEEQAKLGKFRTETLKILKEEVDMLQAKKKALLKEIETLELIKNK